MLNRYHLIAITGGSYTRLHLRLQGQREGQREGQRTDVTCQRQLSDSVVSIQVTRVSVV